MSDNNEDEGISESEKLLSTSPEERRTKKRKHSSGSWRFIPDTILEEGDQIVNFDFLGKTSKLQERNNYESDLGHFMTSDDPDNEDVPLAQNEDRSQSDDDSQDQLDESIDDIHNFPRHHFLNQAAIDEGQIAVHMDIREPLTTLREVLQEKVSESLEGYSFCLQETQILDDDKNLVDQCVQGEGIVQINCEIKEINDQKRINIVDVLKPAEEYVEILGNGEEDGQEEEETNDNTNDQKIRWVVDSAFKKDQEKLGIPQDPGKWSIENVRHWLMWAVRQFSLSGIDLADWAMTGAELSQIKRDQFKAKVPRDPNNAFWTHFELLRKCKIVAVNPHCGNMNSRQDSGGGESAHESRKDGSSKTKPQERVHRMSRMIKANLSDVVDAHYDTIGDDTGEVYDDQALRDTQGTVTALGPVQLWQFLLELLTSYQHRNAIQWLEEEGEFKLVNPELVAHLWGIRKNKPTMNYEKLSRALRYYYDGEMISKVHGKRFVYKFVCDLKQMVGYSATELNGLVLEAELKAKLRADGGSNRKQLTNPIFVNDFITLLP